MLIVLSWLVQCLAVAVLLTGAAYAWEAGTRWSGRPARWAWLAALAGSALLPFALRLIPEETTLPAPIAAFVMDAVVLSAPVQAAAGPRWDAGDVGIALWLTLTASMLLYVAVVMLRLARARRRWRAADVDGGRVWVTRNLGPAALGVRRGVVVVPAWALELEAELRALLLLHEREHVRAGDPRVLFAGLLLVATMPWNPLMWVLLLRLRNAIELDCDTRVLSSGARPERYGSLLLEVGRRRSGSALVMATFAEPRMLLEERIRRIAKWPLERRPGRGALLACVALTLFATALSARVRIDTMQPVQDVKSTVLEAFGLPGVQLVQGERVPYMVSDTPPRALNVPADLLAGPAFTPMTVRPALINQDEVQRALVASYPVMLRDAGIGGSPVVWFLLDTNGVPAKTQLSRSSGYPALDEAALAVAQTMRFSAAMNRDTRVAVWVEIPILFRATGSSTVTPEQRARIEAMARRAQAPAIAPAIVPARPPVPPPAAAPAPMSVRPELMNVAEVAQALARNYPPLLKDAGIGGIAVVWFYIDTQGRVLKTQLSKSSGHRALDEAAINVAQVMRFSPALRDDEKVPMWVELPLAFGDVALPAQRASDHPELPVLNALRAGTPPSPAAPVVAPPPRTDIPVLVPRDLPPPPAPQQGVTDVSAKPVFTPMTVRPELLNMRDIERALVREYPPMLRDAGIGGSPVIWFFIDESGIVKKTQLSKSSGYPVLDDAALRIASTMRFSPALNRDRKVPVWVEIPILFTAK